MITKALIQYVEQAHAAAATAQRELATLAQKEDNPDRKHEIINLRNQASTLLKQIEGLYK